MLKGVFCQAFFSIFLTIKGTLLRKKVYFVACLWCGMCIFYAFFRRSGALGIQMAPQDRAAWEARGVFFQAFFSFFLEKRVVVLLVVILEVVLVVVIVVTTSK